MLLFHAHNPSEWTGPTGNNTYLLTGRIPTLIDAGVGHPAHLAAVADALADQPLSQVLITHGHRDHVAGVPAILELWPSAVVLQGSELAGAGAIEAGDGRLQVIPTPGHAPDHLCFYDELSQDLYCGDLARAGGTIVIPGSRGGNLRQYLASLQRVRELAPRRLLPGHGPVINEPLNVIEQYLSHRAQREAQVIESLRSGCVTAGAVSQQIYGPLPESLTAAAADTVMAHLIKLQEEGIAYVSADGDWRLH